MKSYRNIPSLSKKFMMFFALVVSSTLGGVAVAFMIMMFHPRENVGVRFSFGLITATFGMAFSYVLVFKRPRLRQFVYVIILSCCGVLGVLNSTKLYKMCVIKGYLPGAKVESCRVTQKFHGKGTYGEVYWISYMSSSTQPPESETKYVDYGHWLTLNVGDPIEVIHVGYDHTPYVRNDIYVSAGNFVFDITLMSLWLVGVVAMLILLLRSRRRSYTGQSP